MGNLVKTLIFVIGIAVVSWASYTPYYLPSNPYTIWDTGGLVDNDSNSFGEILNDTAVQVNDQSGNGNHLTQGTRSLQPLLSSGLNGTNALEFTGTQWMTNGDNSDWTFLHSGTTDYTVIFIAQAGTSTNPGAEYGLFATSVSTGRAGAGVYYGDIAANDICTFICSNGAANLVTGLVAADTWPAGSFKLCTVRFESSLGTNAVGIIGETASGIATRTGAYDGSAPINDLVFGAGINSAGTVNIKMVGKIQFVAIWKRYLTQSELGLAYNYLRQRFNVQ